MARVNRPLWGPRIEYSSDTDFYWSDSSTSDSDVYDYTNYNENRNNLDDEPSVITISSDSEESTSKEEESTSPVAPMKVEVTPEVVPTNVEVDPLKYHNNCNRCDLSLEEPPGYEATFAETTCHFDIAMDMVAIEGLEEVDTAVEEMISQYSSKKIEILKLYNGVLDTFHKAVENLGHVMGYSSREIHDSTYTASNVGGMIAPRY